MDLGSLFSIRQYSVFVSIQYSSVFSICQYSVVPMVAALVQGGGSTPQRG
jgi:hypothetical protein